MPSLGLSSFWAKFEELFGADLRSLALLRIGVGLLLIADLVIRSYDLAAHYSDFGILPRVALLQMDRSRWSISVHLLSGLWPVQAILFLIAGAFAVALLLGYKTRWVTPICWFLLISLHGRNPVILIGGDILLRMVLFWGIFLPWGACYSVDKALNPAWDKLPERVVSLGTIAYFVQVILVYWFTALHKSGREWRVEGSAVYYALSVDQFATPVAEFMLQFPLLLKFLTHTVFWYEIVGPLLLFSPFLTGPIRTLAVFGFIFMHIGFWLNLEIGLFAWVGAVSILPFLPTWFWNTWFSRLRTPERLEAKIYFDRDCSFCRKAVRLLHTFFLLPETQVLPAQSSPSIESDMSRHNSWVIEKGGRRHFGFAALVAMTNLSPLLWPLTPLLRLLRVGAVGEKTYAAVANHRRSACAVDLPAPTPQVPGFKLSFFTNVLISLFLLYVLLWNWAGLPGSQLKFFNNFRAIGYSLRIDQIWNMFAPFPLKSDGWYVIPGKLRNGKTVDLFKNGEEVVWEKPLRVAKTYENHRWRKYLMNLYRKEYSRHRAQYASYLCRNWNRIHSNGDKLEELEIIFMLERTLPDYDMSVPEKVSLLRHACETSPPPSVIPAVED